jgi:tetratricopeptide (TPR) repeat protein
MTRTVKAAGLALLVGLMGAGAEAAAAGQVVVRAAPTPERAIELQQQAEALFSQPKQWRRAARLLEASAELRDESDAGTYTCLVYAGRLRAAVGDYERAFLNLEAAAANALARGEVVEAAQAYIDAAHAAAEARRVDEAQDLATRAGLLAQSGLISAEQRAAIIQRLGA